MHKLVFIFFCLITRVAGSAQPGTDVKTDSLRNDFNRLLLLNTGINYATFNNPEGARIQSVATAAQIIAIVPPLLATGDPVAKKVCWSIVGRALLHKPNTLTERKSLVEILCQYYLQSDYDLQTIDNILVQLHADDFSEASKNHIRILFNPAPKFSYGDAARIVAVTQVKESIPALWKIANKNIETMRRGDIDVLASLARMGEKEAAVLLCNYYSSAWNKRERQGVSTKYYVTFANQLAFSLDRTVLDCLVTDFKNFDLSIKTNGGDYFWWPAQHLGKQITDMLKNYLYLKDYNLDPYKLLEWLNSTNKYELKEK